VKLDSTLLLTGLIGAVIGAAIGAIALLAAQGWQLWSARRNAKAAARLIYLEIAYNLSVLKTIGTTTVPLPLLVATSLWDRHSDKLVTIMRERELAPIAFPYVQVEAHRWFFAQPWYFLAVNRLRGDDVAIVGRLTEAFGEAEKALRPKVWTGRRRSALGDAMKVHTDTILKPSLPHRLAAAFRQVPVGALAILALALLIANQVLRIQESFRNRGPGR
jgi:hypothetical protein